MAEPSCTCLTLALKRARGLPPLFKLMEEVQTTVCSHPVRFPPQSGNLCFRLWGKFARVRPQRPLLPLSGHVSLWTEDPRPKLTRGPESTARNVTCGSRHGASGLEGLERGGDCGKPEHSSLEGAAVTHPQGKAAT